MPLLIQIDTPYALVIVGIVVAVATWVVKTLIQQGKDIVALQISFKYYLETISKGAALVLNNPNPTPPEMQELLHKHSAGTLTEHERPRLMEWLRSVRDDPSEERAKRSAAYGMLAAVGAMKRLVKAA